jgi:S1-C subfamily serine protease
MIPPRSDCGAPPQGAANGRAEPAHGACLGRRPAVPLVFSRRGFAIALSALAAFPRARAGDLREVVATLRSSVVPVGTYSATDSPRFGFRGSGFAVGDGSLIATNFHVLPPFAEGESGPRLAVLVGSGGSGASGGSSSGNGELRLARVHATDRARDLALLKIEGRPLKPLGLAEAGAAREGQSVALMGFPVGGALGYSPVTHRGIVASITSAALPAPTAQSLDPRAVARLRDGNFEVLQLDATAYPGNSGGPLFDADTGAVLGLVNMVLIKGSRESALSNPTGITYAIPVRYLLELMQTR